MSLNLSSISSTKLITYLLYLMPFLILTGPFLPDLFLVLIAILFLIEAYKKKLIKYFKNYFFFVLVIFNLYIIFNSVISEFPLFSLKSSLVYFRFSIFTLAIWFALDNEINFKRYFLYGLTIAFLIAIFDGYFQYTFGQNIFGYEAANNNRLNLLISEGWLLGSYLARLLPLFLALALTQYKKTKLNILIIFIMWIASDVLIFLSGERTAIALMIISNIFIILLLKEFRLIRVLSFIISIGIIIIISFLNPAIKERNIDLTINQINIGNGEITFFSRLHETFFHTSVSMFVNNPILGTGPNTYRKYCDNEKYEYISPYSSDSYTYSACSTHPHNSFLQILAETGIIGVSFLIILIIYFSRLILIHMYLKLIIKKQFLSDYEICLIACFLCSLVPFIPSLNFFNNWMNIIYYIPIGFYLHSRNENN